MYELYLNIKIIFYILILNFTNWKGGFHKVCDKEINIMVK
jgi:hypothetical protein